MIFLQHDDFLTYPKMISSLLDLFSAQYERKRSTMAQQKQFKVAAVQMAPVQNDTDATLEKVIGYINEASKAGAEVIDSSRRF